VVPSHDEIKRAGASDAADFGEKDVRGAYSGPLNIAGELVDVEKLPPFGEIDKLVSTFYRCQDGVLARSRELGVGPEVFWPDSRTWHAYPELDIWHDARTITRADVFDWFPDVTDADLDRAPDTA
jgi:hypothetical protein